MSFTGHEDHGISLADAAAMTKRYRNANINDSLGGFFGREFLEKLLKTSECVGLRYYFALDDSNVLKVVLVGADQNEEDLLDDGIAEFSLACPSHCASDNELNS